MTALFADTTGKGNFKSIKDEDLELINSKVKPISEEALFKAVLLNYFGLL